LDEEQDQSQVRRFRYLGQEPNAQSLDGDNCHWLVACDQRV